MEILSARGSRGDPFSSRLLFPRSANGPPGNMLNHTRSHTYAAPRLMQDFAKNRNYAVEAIIGDALLGRISVNLISITSKTLYLRDLLLVYFLRHVLSLSLPFVTFLAMIEVFKFFFYYWNDCFIRLRRAVRKAVI